MSDAVMLLEDLIDIQARNLMERQRFMKTRRRALFLPHCSRKCMDGQCKATFDPSVPSYVCAHCSEECLVNQANICRGEKRLRRLRPARWLLHPEDIENKSYEGAVGVAWGEETRLAGDILDKLDIAGQAIPLIKNGCANTVFNVDTLIKTL